MDILKKVPLIFFLTHLYIFFLITSNIVNAISIPNQKENSFHEDFLGKWEMQSIVTKSNCPYVLVGSTTQSNLEIKPIFSNTNEKFHLKALWKGGRWTESNGEIKILSKTEAITERVTKMKTYDNNNWKAILIDHLKLDENNIMHSDSIVIQYKNGISVGEYKTYSILTKVRG